MEHITEEEARPRRGRKPTLVIEPRFLEELKREVNRTPKKPVVRYPILEFLNRAKLPEKYEHVGNSAFLASRLSRRYRSQGLAFSSRCRGGSGVPDTILVYNASREDRVKKGRRGKQRTSS